MYGNRTANMDLRRGHGAPAPKPVLSLPLSASETGTGVGATGHASPNSVDSVKVASGTRPPMRGEVTESLHLLDELPQAGN
jgi:hypothetical protein